MVRRKAFTMVEVIMVIIIFGIIATIGAEIISKMYLNYIQARTVAYLQSQSDITLQQIAKRLQYRIKDSTVACITIAGGACVAADTHSLADERVDEDYNVIQWIGYSNEALLGGGVTPGWSGFIDLDSADTSNAGSSLDTPGSDLVTASNIISALTNGIVTLGNREVALVFKGTPIYYENPYVGYGWDGAGGISSHIIRVNRNGDDVFTIIGDVPDRVYEQYYLAHTAYAIAATNVISETNFDLRLYYNFRPWTGTTFDDAGVPSALLANHVNLFRAKQIGSTIHMKLCLNDAGQSGLGGVIAACKEEVIL